MTEQEWLACTDPEPMLESLRGRASDRKLRLFAVACCRHIWHSLADERSRRGVEVAECQADGFVTSEELDVAWRAAADAARHDDRASLAAMFAAGSPARYAAQTASQFAALTRGNPTEVTFISERRHQSLVLYELFGNPFRPLGLDRSWVTADVIALAQAAYDRRTLPSGTLKPLRLALLADALEDAGCTSPEILGHLRGPGPHVRGCWAVDLCLGRE